MEPPAKPKNEHAGLVGSCPQYRSDQFAEYLNRAHADGVMLPSRSWSDALDFVACLSPGLRSVVAGDGVEILLLHLAMFLSDTGISVDVSTDDVITARRVMRSHLRAGGGGRAEIRLYSNDYVPARALDVLIIIRSAADLTQNQGLNKAKSLCLDFETHRAHRLATVPIIAGIDAKKWKESIPTTAATTALDSTKALLLAMSCATPYYDAHANAFGIGPTAKVQPTVPSHASAAAKVAAAIAAYDAGRATYSHARPTVSGSGPTADFANHKADPSPSPIDFTAMPLTKVNMAAIGEEWEQGPGPSATLVGRWTEGICYGLILIEEACEFVNESINRSACAARDFVSRYRESMLIFSKAGLAFVAGICACTFGPRVLDNLRPTAPAATHHNASAMFASSVLDAPPIVPQWMDVKIVATGLCEQPNYDKNGRLSYDAISEVKGSQVVEANDGRRFLIAGCWGTVGDTFKAATQELRATQREASALTNWLGN